MKKLLVLALTLLIFLNVSPSQLAHRVTEKQVNHDPHASAQPFDHEREAGDLVVHTVKQGCSLHVERVAPGGMNRDDEIRKSYSTQYNSDRYLQKWILPRWRSYRLSEVKAVAVEQWLKTFSFENGDPLASGSKAKIRNIHRWSL